MRASGRASTDPENYFAKAGDVFMKLFLIVPVYNGGDYWRECWSSIKNNLDFFDGIYISFNYSPKQAEDITLVLDFPSKKLHWIKHDKMMSAVEHSLKIDRWIGSLHLSGHLMILCHDDILLREGLKELSKMELQDGDAVFGSFHFFSQTGHTQEMTVREFHRDDGQPLPGNEFAFLQDQKFLTYNMSGVILPVKMFRDDFSCWHLLAYGCRAENSHLCNPYVKRVFQTFSPTVSVRWHVDSEGTKMSKEMNQYDTLVYLLVSFVTYKEKYQRNMIARSIGYTIRLSPFRGMRYFLQLQFRLGKLPYYYPEGWKIYGFMFWLLSCKGWNLCRKMCRVS